MKKQTTILMGLGAFALAQSAPLLADGVADLATGGLSPQAYTAGGEGGEGGEAGHDDEGPDLKADDMAYLTRLGLIEGHLWVGVELYHAGDKAAAKTHMKHPGDELYEALEPAFKARHVPGFEGEMAKLAEAVDGEKPAGEVDAAYAAVSKAIEASKAGLKPDAKATLLIAASLVRTAGNEYGVGVAKDGKVVKPHEYQDAYGFTHIADRMIDGLMLGEAEEGGEKGEKGEKHEASEAEEAGEDAELAHEAEEQMESLAPAWPKVVPPETVAFDASKLHGVAAKLEILAQDAD